MKKKANWFVWAWADAKGEVFFVSAAPEVKGVPPWDDMWHRRFKLPESPIVKKLRSTIDPPQRISVGCDGAMSRDAAEVLKAQNVAALEAQGYKLLSTRPQESFVTGGGKDKPVVSPENDLHASVRAAGLALNVSHGTVVRWLKNPKSGWRYH